MLCVCVFRKVFLFINVASFSVRHIGQNEKFAKNKTENDLVEIRNPKTEKKKDVKQ